MDERQKAGGVWRKFLPLPIERDRNIRLETAAFADERSSHLERKPKTSRSLIFCRLDHLHARSRVRSLNVAQINEATKRANDCRTNKTSAQTITIRVPFWGRWVGKSDRMASSGRM